jgi:peptidoglycan/xylan/chitin deacetylase (PgdA/CDA1 family)
MMLRMRVLVALILALSVPATTASARSQGPVTSSPAPSGVVHPSKTQVFRRLDHAGPRVALTFDDCDHKHAWTRLLNILRTHHAKATFFCPGEQVVRFPDLARRTVAQGNGIGSHGWDHRDPKDLSYRKIRTRMVKDKEVWRRTTHESPTPYYRPPYGAYDSKTLRAASDTGFTRMILWDVDSYDWKRPGSGRIAHRVLSRIQRGSIVEMNVLGETASALPTILRGLRRKGLRPVTLPVLFQSAGFH